MGQWVLVYRVRRLILFLVKELLSLPKEVMLMEDAIDFSVGFGETKCQIVYLCKPFLRVCQQFPQSWKRPSRY